MWKLSKKNNSLFLSDKFISFLKDRFIDKGFAFSRLSFSIGDNLFLEVQLKVFKKKGVLDEV